MIWQIDPATLILRQVMGSRATPFVILATQRTGSSWVGQMLGSHPAVGMSFELFEPRGTREQYFEEHFRRRAAHHNALNRARLCFGFLNELFASRPELDAVGFKLMYSHVKTNPAVVAYIALHRVRVIHLVRSNLLDILVSRDTARARGRYHSDGDGSVKEVVVELDPASVVERLTALERQGKLMRRALAVTRTQTREVSYENLLAEPARFEDLLRFLGVAEPDRELTAELQKINTSGKRAVVSNYDAIESTLRGTRFAGFLD